MPLNKPMVTIIIVNWNGKKHLTGCLNSLKNQRYHDFEVVLVDNGSVDESVGFVQKNFPEVKIVQLPKNLGYSVGMNAGIENSKSKYVIALNNDTTVDQNWLSELIKMAESNQRIGSCQPKILSMQNPQTIDTVGLALNWEGDAYQLGVQEKDTGQYSKPKELLGACSASVLYRRSAIEQIGGFDPDFFAFYEDVDVALRLKKAGWKCMFVPSAVVYHYGSATAVTDSPFKTYLLERNQYYYKIKNQPAKILLRFILKQPKKVSRKLYKFARNKKLSLVPSYVKGNIAGLREFSKIYRKRNQQICFLKKPLTNQS